jgi:hypothetical protein
VNRDGVLQAVADLALSDQDAIARELFTRVEARNYVPRGLEREYSWALLMEYNRRMPKAGR